jgi:hypothetical protein
MSMNQLVSWGYSLPDFAFTYYVSGTIDASADLGKAVSLDTAANTVKLAGAGDKVFGRLESYEDRAVLGIKVGAVARKFKHLLPIASGLTGFDAVAVGDTVVGAGSGKVKALNNGSAKTPDVTDNTVVELVTINSVAYAAVEKL